MFRIISKLKNKRGFTLIELIVVLAVLAIIMAIAVPRFLGVQEQAKIDADKSTLGLIAKTAEFYYTQGKIGTTYEGAFKTVEGLVKDSLDKDFPELAFQSSSGDIDDVQIKIDASTGKAYAKFGSIESE